MRGDRWTAAAGAALLAGIGVGSVLALDRILEGGTVLRAGLAATLGAHLFGNLPRRWGRAAPTAASAIGLLALLAVIVERPTTWHWVPTPSTFESLARDALDGIGELRVAVPPAEATPGLLVLALTSVCLLSLASSLMRARWDAPLQAIAPPWALVLVTAFLGEGPRHAERTVALLVASLAVVLVEDHRITRTIRWFGPGPRLGAMLRSSALPLLVAAPLAGVLGARLVAPSNATPGLLANAGRDRVVVSPLVDIRSRLRDPGNTQVFTVVSPVAANWRLTALDDFDGVIWSAKDRYRKTHARLPPEEGSDTRGSRSPTREVRQVFHIDALASVWLPVAYRPTGIDLDGVRVSYSSLSLVADQQIPRGLTYEATSDLPTRDSLSGAQGAPPASVRAQLALPRAFPQEVVRIAERATESAASPFQKAQLLEQHFRGSFAYDEDVSPGHSSDDLVEFLTATKRGYCEQFAGAFAAMARAVGLPSRVAVGFTPGRLDPATSTFVVTERDAHAWPEVYLPQAGWTAFEPTPGRDIATSAPGTAEGGEGVGLGPERAAGSNEGTTRPTAGGAPSDREGANEATGARTPWTQIGLAALALLAIAALFVPAWKRARRRGRIAERDPAENISGAWHEATALLLEWGYTPSPSATPLEVAHDVPAGGAALLALAELCTAARYAPVAPTRDEARSAWDAVAVLQRSLDRQDSPAGRILRRLDPRSLGHP